MSIVRIATREDEPELLRLLRLMHAEGGLLPLDEGEARNTFEQAFSRNFGLIGVIGRVGRLEAAIGLRIAKFWYTKANHLEEMFNFVDPDHRRSNHAKILIEFAKECAKKIDIPLWVGILTNARMAPKVRLYRGRLGTPSGAYFIYNSIWKVEEPTISDFWNSIESRSERALREKHLSRATQTAVMA